MRREKVGVRICCWQGENDKIIKRHSDPPWTNKNLSMPPVINGFWFLVPGSWLRNWIPASACAGVTILRRNDKIIMASGWRLGGFVPFAGMSPLPHGRGLDRSNFCLLLLSSIHLFARIWP